MNWRRRRTLIKNWLTPQERSAYYAAERVGNIIPLRWLMHVHRALYNLALARRNAYIAAKALAATSDPGRTGQVQGPEWMKQALYYSLAFRRYKMHTEGGGTAKVMASVEALEL